MIFEPFITFITKVLFFSGLVSDKSSFPRPLSKSDEEEYMRRFKYEGDMQAKDLLIRHNLRLVAHVVKKYNGSAEADDLISCGAIGLIKAINSFNPEKGVQISTYAARCIENEILMFLRVTKKHQQVGSLNESFGSDRDGSELVLSDIIPDDGPDEKELGQHKIMMKKLVGVMKERLDEREFKIISLRYGFEDNISLPQREVAKKLGISRSYISRIEKHAIEIIKEIVNEDDFKGFYENYV
ncbi:MAG: RNA polymerase sporulation sigma factor SigK [Firmicutes bacterium]|nr:RNA polymerase sporulation sigma factor SigK [Bacillota bacterium]